MMREALDQDKNVSETLNAHGCKGEKILFRKGSTRQLEMMVEYFRSGSLPSWVLESHEKLLKTPESEIVTDSIVLLRKQN